MTTRWLAGLALFALGFGCAQMIEVTTADAADEAVVEGLELVDRGDAFELINAGPLRFLITVERKEGAEVSEPQVGLETGSAAFSKEGLESLTVLEVRARGKVTAGDPTLRECRPDFEDCPLPRPLPPPPPPMMFLEP